ncbi:hypothetical protein E2C01_071551 [Portunus trituberculatus]|uniref:Uncharacterized protein n=1 Tax=Portunus trituberculatus TaxID=210409 RepID=A0A5B7I578_PORTR|nr:hypothetical protein [Portunus trituberculatus]
MRKEGGREGVSVESYRHAAVLSGGVSFRNTWLTGLSALRTSVECKVSSVLPEESQKVLLSEGILTFPCDFLSHEPVSKVNYAGPAWLHPPKSPNREKTQVRVNRPASSTRPAPAIGCFFPSLAGREAGGGAKA